MKCLEIQQSYRIVICYSYGLCLIIYLVKYLSSYVRLIMLCQVRFGLVRFGYMSFLPKSQATVVSIRDHYDDMALVRLWLDQVTLGWVMLCQVWLGTVWFSYISFLYFITQKLGTLAAVPVSTSIIIWCHSITCEIIIS